MDHQKVSLMNQQCQRPTGRFPSGTDRPVPRTELTKKSPEQATSSFIWSYIDSRFRCDVSVTLHVWQKPFFYCVKCLPHRLAAVQMPITFSGTRPAAGFPLLLLSINAIIFSPLKIKRLRCLVFPPYFISTHAPKCVCFPWRIIVWDTANRKYDMIWTLYRFEDKCV